MTYESLPNSVVDVSTVVNTCFSLTAVLPSMWILFTSKVEH